jgi:Sec-independent protein translocase protein TatA
MGTVHVAWEATMESIGAPELIVIALIVVLLFGARRIREIGDGVGLR